MNRIYGSKSLFLLTSTLCGLLLLSGCQQSVVYQRSLADLNQKAQTMIQSGDINGAVSRLEAAHDLEPDEPNTTRNLAIAYQMQGNYDKAIQTFTLLLDKPGMDKAEIQKNLGVTYEAKADKLDADLRGMQDDPKADKTQATQLQQETAQSYKMALNYYQQSVKGLSNPGDVEKQIAALESKLKPSDAASSQSALP